VAATLNIAALTRRTGVPPDTIRKWEQRYNVLHPERTAGGQRRYSELDIARIEWLKARLEEGFRIGEAAALLGSALSAPSSPDEIRCAIVEATSRSDVGALGAAIEQALMLDAVEDAFRQALAPALVEIGDLWARGELTVAQEHLASGTIRAALQRLLADQRGPVRGTAVLACAPGERHEVGLLMIAVLMRADGWEVAYLGPDIPAAETIGLARELGAAAVLFSATREETAQALERELAAVEIPDDVTFLVGGRATDEPDLVATIAALR
jgi:MerR family transcriptional regulator, light-induced transcriptional regulator